MIEKQTGWNETQFSFDSLFSHLREEKLHNNKLVELQQLTSISVKTKSLACANQLAHFSHVILPQVAQAAVVANPRLKLTSNLASKPSSCIFHSIRLLAWNAQTKNVQ